MCDNRLVLHTTGDIIVKEPRNTSPIEYSDLNVKFGASVATGKHLLEKAKELDMNVVGVR